MTVAFINRKNVFSAIWPCVFVCLFFKKGNCPPKLNNWLCHRWQQVMQSSVCDNWQQVFHIAVTHSSWQN